MTTPSRTCPSCQAEVATSDAECPKCGWHFVEMTVARPAPVARPRIPVEVELLNVIDRTGSSAAFAVGIGKMLAGILACVAAKTKSVKVWTQTHGDQDYKEFPLLITDGGTIEEAIADAEGIVFEGGGDAAEHHLDGVEKAFQAVPWSDDRRRARGVMICYLTADSKPATSGHTPEQIGKAIAARNVLFYLVGQKLPQVQALCKAAKGLFVEISNDPKDKDIERIASEVSASIVASVAMAQTTPVVAGR